MLASVAETPCVCRELHASNRVVPLSVNFVQEKQRAKKADEEKTGRVIDDRPLAENLSEQTSRRDVVKVHHIPRVPAQAGCGVLCCLTVTHFRVLFVARCVCTHAHTHMGSNHQATRGATPWYTIHFR